MRLNQKNKIIGSLFVIIFSIFFFYFINFMFLNDLIVDDTAKFDSENPSLSQFFNLFYLVTSETGYQPEPSKFNFFITGLIGLIFGVFVSKKYFK